MNEPRAEFVGYASLAEAQKLLKEVGDDFVIAKISNAKMYGEALAYVVIHKDAGPINTGATAIRARGET
jgi:hypothetical protein